MDMSVDLSNSLSFDIFKVFWRGNVEAFDNVEKLLFITDLQGFLEEFSRGVESHHLQFKVVVFEDADGGFDGEYLAVE